MIQWAHDVVRNDRTIFMVGPGRRWHCGQQLVLEGQAVALLLAVLSVLCFAADIFYAHGIVTDFELLSTNITVLPCRHAVAAFR